MGYFPPECSATKLKHLLVVVALVVVVETLTLYRAILFLFSPREALAG